MSFSEVEGTAMKEAGTDARTAAAEEIVAYIRDRLVVLMPYFNRALLCMPVEFEESAERKDGEGPGSGKSGGRAEGGASPDRGEAGAPASDGDVIRVGAAEILRVYREDENRLARIFLHMIFHCVYCHPFRTAGLDPKRWDAASDIAAESVILGLGIRELGLPDDGPRQELVDRVIRSAGEASAERIYHYLSGNPREAEDIFRSEGLYRMDSHRLWVSGNDASVREIYTSKSAADQFEEKVRKWMKLQQSARSETLSGRHSMGDQAGTRKDRIRGLKRDDYDYSEFLKRFARRTEEVRINPEEFDYIYYTYGLSLYENMPLIEPLEYRDALKICDFVIAIDTSGSCQGYTVRRFLDKTWSLLKNSDIFPERMNLRIIQCDCEIQSEALITSEEEFNRYMREIEIAGAGGTDFTPVFERVDELLREGEFHDFRGMIYFTDGLGRFPAQKPAYRTAFVSVGRSDDVPQLPAWAESCVLPDI